MNSKTAARERRRSLALHRGQEPLRAPPKSGQIILLMSSDERFHERLRSAANRAGLLLVKVEAHLGVSAILQATRPVAVLLDLDLPDREAWPIAKQLLASTKCPPVLLVSAGPPLCETRTGVFGNGPLNKAQSPADLLQILEEVLDVPRASRSEWPELQKAPLNRQQGWEEPSIPACRFWGINE